MRVNWDTRYMESIRRGNTLLKIKEKKMSYKSKYTGAQIDANLDIVSTGLAIKSDETGLKIIRGSVNSDGSIAGGSGFSVTKTGTGAYRINFTTAFSNNYITSLAIQYNNGGAIQYSSPDKTTVTFTTFNISPLAVADNAFSFIVIGLA